MDKKRLKEDCIKLFLEGKNYAEIAKQTGWSRTTITNLIKDDERVKEKLNCKKIKVHKRKDEGRLTVLVPTQFLKKIGISKDLDKQEYVVAKFDEKTKNIIIEKA